MKTEHTQNFKPTTWDWEIYFFLSAIDINKRAAEVGISPSKWLESMNNRVEVMGNAYRGEDSEHRTRTKF